MWQYEVTRGRLTELVVCHVTVWLCGWLARVAGLLQDVASAAGDADDVQLVRQTTAMCCQRAAIQLHCRRDVNHCRLQPVSVYAYV